MSEPSNSLMPAARSELATATGANPLVARGLLDLAERRIDCHDSDCSDIQEALAHYHRGVELLDSHGGIDEVLSEMDEAIRHFDSAILRNPNNSTAQRHRDEALAVKACPLGVRQRRLLDRIRRARAKLINT